MSELLLYTAQSPVVLEALRRDGVERVKREYVDRKYGQSAWSFQEAYSFFRAEADSRWCFMGPDSLLMSFRVPEEKVIFFDRRLWERVLNLEYIGEDAADEARFEAELRSMGVNDCRKVFSCGFYPLQKRKVRESWKRLFSSGGCETAVRQAAVWELRSEWLVDVKGPEL